MHAKQLREHASLLTVHANHNLAKHLHCMLHLSWHCHVVEHDKKQATFLQAPTSQHSTQVGQIGISKWRDHVLQACAVRPCASTWLGAGIAYLRLQDFDNADVAMMEANVMNNRHAEVWGYLALLALLTAQEAEAEQALTWALRCELSNVQLLNEIGEQYMTMGR